MAPPSGFAYRVRKSGEVVISHWGRDVVVLRGDKARKFISQLAMKDDQELMARVTGNYKRGTER